MNSKKPTVDYGQRHAAIPLRALGALVFGIATTLAACGGDGDSNATTTPVASTTASTAPSVSATSTPPPATTEAGIALAEFAVKAEQTRARPGTVVFKVRNEGTVAHQFVVIRSNVPSAQLPRRENNQGADDTQLDVVDKIETIAAGATAELRVPVEAGKYVLICNIVASGTSHYLSGMYTPFTVETTAPLPSPSQ